MVLPRPIWESIRIMCDFATRLADRQHLSGLADLDASLIGSPNPEHTVIMEQADVAIGLVYSFASIPAFAQSECQHTTAPFESPY
jgi:hypothetical protein